jgi:lactate dehydrogenase-like 2-hydroxyacid dehydrogenase
MKPLLLVVGNPMPMITDQLAAHFTLVKLADVVNPADFTYVAMAGHGKIDVDFYNKFPNVKMISSFGVGYDSIDAVEAGKRGVIVTNTPDVLTEEVADTALALLLATIRKIPQQDKYVREGGWEKAAYPLTGSLQERSIGILGLGRIGKAIAKRCEAFGLPVSYHNRTHSDMSYPYFKTLKEMAAAVNTIIIVTPGGASTKHLINKEILETLGADGVIINVGRGSVVDEKALITALQNKTIAMAGLDVFEDEPRVPAELRAMDNVVLLPHIGSGTVYTRNKMGQLVVDNLMNYLHGKPVISPVPETPVKAS